MAMDYIFSQKNKAAGHGYLVTAEKPRGRPKRASTTKPQYDMKKKSQKVDAGSTSEEKIDLVANQNDDTPAPLGKSWDILRQNF